MQALVVLNSFGMFLISQFFVEHWFLIFMTVSNVIKLWLLAPVT